VEGTLDRLIGMPKILTADSKAVIAHQLVGADLSVTGFDSPNTDEQEQIM